MSYAVAEEVLPYHDSPPLAGYSRPALSVDLIHTMAQRVMEFHPASDSEALKLLRSSFPSSPLSLRVAALDFLNKKLAR